LIVLAKEPRPGRVKTRLCPPFSPVQAAELASAAIADTLAAVLEAVPKAGLRGHHVEPVLVLDGRPGKWLFDACGGSRIPLRVIRQRSGGLDLRIAGAFEDATANATQRRALLVGMDTPQLTSSILADAGPDADAVLGLAHDGGWWGMGLCRPDASLLLGVPMSTPNTGQAQRHRLAASGLSISMLRPLRDVDTAADADHVGAEAPESRFAAALARARSQGSQEWSLLAD
jgi:hypothetical protein